MKDAYQPPRRPFDIPDDSRFQRDEETGNSHRDGVPWYQAVVPPVIHDCSVQTIGLTTSGSFVSRCACGAIRGEGLHGMWVERNSRQPATQPVQVGLTESEWAAEHYRQQRVRNRRIAIVALLVAAVVIILLLAIAGNAAGIDTVRPRFLLGGEYPA